MSQSVKHIKLPILIAVTIICIGLISFVINIGKNNNSVKAPSKSEQKLDDNETKAAKIDIKIRNFAFLPNKLEIQKGTSIQWVNRDDAAHKVVAADGSFNSGLLKTDQQFSHTFENVGTYNYSCTIHPSMKAVVVVRD